VRHDDRVLAARRLPGGPAGLKWEFPGGKVESDESPRSALIREIEEELGLTVDVGPELGVFVSPLGQRAIRLQCYLCTVDNPNVQLRAHSEVMWCSIRELALLDWAAPDVPAVERLTTAWDDIW